MFVLLLVYSKYKGYSYYRNIILITFDLFFKRRFLEEDIF